MVLNTRRSDCGILPTPRRFEAGLSMSREQAEKLVDAIFKDLRDRRFLKWMFNEDGADAGPILMDSNGQDLMPLDVDVQNEIREAWITLAMST
jgi:hypothetical protein